MGYQEVSQTPLFLLGALLGALLLAIGLGLGCWIGRTYGGGAKQHRSQTDRIAQLLSGLFKWTDTMAREVSDYQAAVSEIASQLSSLGKGSMLVKSKEASDVFNQILQANELLQNRLDSAESSLERQAIEIVGYLSDAQTDALTNLPNRRAFDDALAQKFSQCRKNQNPVSLVLVDIDLFKMFNDRHGHLAGDAILCETAIVLRQSVDASHFVARIGGEEFAVVLNQTDLPAAQKAAEKIRKAVEDNIYNYEGQPLNVTVSCGGSEAVPGEQIFSFIKRADQALYASKAAGRNAAYWYNGQTCQRISPATKSSAITSSPIANLNDRRSPERLEDPAERQAKDFVEVCSDLRRRLTEMASRQKEKADGSTTSSRTAP